MTKYAEDEYDEMDRKRWNEIRIRNLKINIAKILLSRDDVNKKTFSKLDLKNNFAFKECDFKYLIGELFSFAEDQYTLNDDVREFLHKVILSYRTVQQYLCEAESEFLRIYGEYNATLERDMYHIYNAVKYHEMYERIKEFLPILHWGKLPIFDRYLLYNRNIDPEVDTIDFYDHTDCLDALLAEVRHNGVVLSNESDLSLERDMNFEVYTRRWKSVDTYKIKRTVDGWDCRHIAINGKCEKDGSGSLILNLKHDSVFFPEDGVKYAMEKLWEEADDGDINFEELSRRIQQVADWISTVEKAVASQPEWVGYY